MFKNLNQFKNNVKIGQKVTVINHLKKYTEDRVVVHVQSNAIATGVEITEEEYEEKSFDWLNCNRVIQIDDKYYTKVFLDFQKAKHMRFENNTVSFLAFEFLVHNDKTSVVPSKEFNVGETWLELQFND